MPKPLVLTLLLLAATRGFAAEEIEPLDAEFLDYLSQLEDDDDDWTLVADADSAATQATSKAAARRAARKAARQAQQQEAAKPAADER
jgi:cob(I)alamin adenosyltransferase